ncbi:unnamed protein product [Coffea canephora]|uniref:26S proteasome non-ATPase regulatory subunit 1/RPN2 N-terminal domain-containing protein n=1 Tax=Coffea canephora TaxID=49390 RepID=A0A068UGF5_COFCA|nr:unnamed protein product [Coffea canephora]
MYTTFCMFKKLITECLSFCSESVYEDEEFDETQRQLAALLASKIQTCFSCIFNSLLVICYWNELNHSLLYALGADLLFDVSEDSYYVRSILAKAIDECPDLKTKAAESNKVAKIDSRSKFIVKRMLDKKLIQRLLVIVFQKLPSPDYLSICQLLMFLDRPQDIAAVFEKLLRTESNNDALLGFQIAFNLVENEHQAFLLKMKDQLFSLKEDVYAERNNICHNATIYANSIMHAVRTVNTLLCTCFAHHFICCIMIKVVISI